MRGGRRPQTELPPWFYFCSQTEDHLDLVSEALGRVRWLGALGPPVAPRGAWSTHPALHRRVRMCCLFGCLPGAVLSAEWGTEVNGVGVGLDMHVCVPVCP